MLKQILVIMAVSAISKNCPGGEPLQSQVRIYLFPGLGADYRQFRDLKFPAGYDTVHISYPVPEKRESMSQYARRFIPLINQDLPYMFVGVSLGGMICTELADILQPRDVILISSAKAAFELPRRYTFMGKSHINRIVPKRLVKAGARILMCLVEPDCKYDLPTFRDMLRLKDPLYLKRTADMIVCWDREHYKKYIIHIHGNADHTIPIENVKYDYLIENGSHLMALTRADTISRIICEILTAPSR